MHYVHGAECIFMSTGMSTLLVDEYEYTFMSTHIYEYT